MPNINLTLQESQLLVNIINLAPVNGTFGQRQDLINVLIQVDQLANKLIANPVVPQLNSLSKLLYPPRQKWWGVFYFSSPVFPDN